MPVVDGYQILESITTSLDPARRTLPVIVLTADATPEARRQNELLEDRVRARTMELERAQLETFERLALAAEYRDDDTGKHTRRVGGVARAIAEKLGMTGIDLDLLELAAGLHDVGKIGVPDGILLKPDRLTPSWPRPSRARITSDGMGAAITGSPAKTSHSTRASPRSPTRSTR